MTKHEARASDGEPPRFGRVRLPDGAVVSGELQHDGVRVDGVVVALDGATVLAPCEPSKLICVGLNYRDHAAEVGMDQPEEPLLFLKPPSSVIGHGESIVQPLECDRLDYEGELAVVIGRRARRVRVEEALDYVAGLTVANDVTARDLQTPGSQWTRAKGYDTFAPIGPWLVGTTDWSGRAIETRVNGAVVQHSTTDRLIFGVPTLIAAAAAVMTLEPGDLLLTGTPRGVGPVQPGDTVEVTVEGIGTLRNQVVAEGAAAAGPTSKHIEEESA